MERKYKILTVIGARPQFVKAAVLSRAWRGLENAEEVLLHTGQHFDQGMSDIFFEEMEIPLPKYNLGIHSVNQGAMTGRMMEGIEQIILDEKPDIVLLYGDTNSTLAGALAAQKLHVKVAHVEAGLRSYNMRMPEEINRILTDRVSDLLFCPTDTAIGNLKKEGYDQFPGEIVKSGDVMLDAAMYYADKSAVKSTVMEKIGAEPFVLATLHRAENTDDPQRLKAIVDALHTIHEKCRIVLPLHPRTKGALERAGLSLDVTILPPVGYFDMIELLKNCALVMTDSGGLQKEAFFFKKLCITMRDQTEWVELIEHGFNTLVGADGEQIIAAFEQYRGQSTTFDKDLYGDGKAGQLIANKILHTLA